MMPKSGRRKKVVENEALTTTKDGVVVTRRIVRFAPTIHALFILQATTSGLNVSTIPVVQTSVAPQAVEAEDVVSEMVAVAASGAVVTTEAAAADLVVASMEAALVGTMEVEVPISNLPITMVKVDIMADVELPPMVVDSIIFNRALRGVSEADKETVLPSITKVPRIRMRRKNISFMMMVLNITTAMNRIMDGTMRDNTDGKVRPGTEHQK
mmetsp:Transcript_35613/g.102600  ORF Transcript_35613/g.102600 Transcript_35613/m.102600 type:complete len:212 (-) Transcript_35613:2769-3404(-)